MDDMEKQIARRVRKRFFDKDEQIDLKLNRSGFTGGSKS